ncbi:peptidoglycan DD-metalloendopeptidase family protein [Granulosicoccaceae sp. 1_MG-2023]|nr:peptidoglycan DD-metalloendopeptidase family protein [Granulosicoccaceae sp. 1_MG-2023]
MVAAFFVFSALIATVSNGNADGKADEGATGTNLLQNALTERSSLSDPDFYFIDSNQFVPGSGHMQMAAISGDIRDPNIIPSPSSADKPLTEGLKGAAPLDVKPPFSQGDQTAAKPAAPEFTDETVTVKSGDTLSHILLRNGVDESELFSLTNNKTIKDYFLNLRVGQKLYFRRAADGSFASISRRLGLDRKVVVSRGDDGFVGSEIEMPVTRKLRTAAATIESSLFLAGQGVNLSQKTIMNLVDIFQWDVDFSQDVRKGDSFKVIYEELYRDGEALGAGDIVAAEFTNSGRTIRALRYTDFNGRTSYYTPEGRAMRKAFLRNPVDVVRITSHFNPNRKHPVLHTIRAHKGTDYGAPIGTPIRSSGDGKIIFAGVKGGYGNTIVIKHGEKYTTLYAHMNKFAKGMRSGKRVTQGQIIGYVGKTGRVTGPHLHYEFRINGVHKNPLKVKLPGAKPLAEEYKADFLNKARPYLATLSNLNPTTVASTQ